MRKYSFQRHQPAPGDPFLASHCFGAAANVAVPTGVYSRPDEAAQQMSPGSTSVDPDHEMSSQYEPYYQKRLETYH